MSFKRFAQLFVCYLVAMTLAILITDTFSFEHIWSYILCASVIGYVVLIIPLTVLTLLKRRKK